MMLGKLFFLLFLPTLFFAQAPDGYYAGTENLTGYALKSKLYEIISKKTISYNYTSVATLYQTTDLDVYYDHTTADNPYFDTVSNKTKYILLDIYSENPKGPDAYEYTSDQNISSASVEGLGYNKEHGMPQSTFYGIYPMYSDIHYLIPADAYINQRRSNYPYARNDGKVNSTSNGITYSNGSKLGKSTTPGYTNTVYEPIDEFKGDVARYLLYFVVRYEGSLNSMNHQLATCPLDGSEEKAYEDWYITMLKDWNKLDPVSQRERDRNNAVYALEKTRNPFIDDETLVDKIWSETTDSVAPQAPQNLTSSAIGESFVTLSWMPSPDTDVLGYNIYKDGVYYGYSKTNSLSVDRLTAATSYNFTVKAYDKGYLLSPNSNTFTVSTLASDTLAKDLMITKYIEGTTNTTTGVYNNAIEITNKTGHEVNLNNYYLNIQFKSSTGYYFSDAFKLEGSIPANSVVVITHPGSNFANYPISKADFVTGAPPLAYTGSQYVELSYGTKYLKTASTNNYDMSYTTVDAVGIKDQSNSSTNSNVSLYRNTNVTDPRTDFTISEWTRNALNYTTGLGSLSSKDVNLVADKLSIYPNPASEFIKISGKNIQNISKAQIFDMNGKLVLEVNNPFRISDSIGVSLLNTGVYILKLDGQNLRFIKK